MSSYAEAIASLDKWLKENKKSKYFKFMKDIRDYLKSKVTR